MKRRGFLQSMLALGAAPAVISSGVLMPIKSLLLPGDGEFIGLDFAEGLPGTYVPVNFVLMRQLLHAARKKLPYFSGTLPGVLKPSQEDSTVRWEKVESGLYVREVLMTQAG